MNKTSVTDKDHHRGKLNAPITLIEYGDFECFHCGMAFYEIEKILAEAGENICFAYRHFPLTEIHPHAMAAAVASESAAEQGKFWEMHHLLFQNQENLSQDAISYLAEILGVDMEPFEEGLQRKDLIEKIEKDLEDGIQLGVSGTPSIFINGQKLNSSASYENLMIAVQEILYGGREPVVNS